MAIASGAIAIGRAKFHNVTFDLDAPEGELVLMRDVARFPFVPSDPAELRENCYEAYNIQVQGLTKRLQASRTKSCYRSVRWSRFHPGVNRIGTRHGSFGSAALNVLAFTLPGFATSEQTKANAWLLMSALGATPTK